MFLWTNKSVTLIAIAIHIKQARHILERRNSLPWIMTDSLEEWNEGNKACANAFDREYYICCCCWWCFFFFVSFVPNHLKTYFTSYLTLSPRVYYGEKKREQFSIEKSRKNAKREINISFGRTKKNFDHNLYLRKMHTAIWKWFVIIIWPIQIINQ